MRFAFISALVLATTPAFASIGPDSDPEALRPKLTVLTQPRPAENEVAEESASSCRATQAMRESVGRDTASGAQTSGADLPRVACSLP